MDDEQRQTGSKSGEAPAQPAAGKTAKTFWSDLRSKSAWDWLTLLVVPVVIALAGFIFSEYQRRNNVQVENDPSLQGALQQYIDYISDLMLNQNLRLSEPNSDIRMIARARTLSVLSTLDGELKGALLRYLYESKLIVYQHDHQGETGIIDLEEADLSGTILPGASLTDANLTRVDLSGADLRGASLQNAFLYGALLAEADLSDARLSGANLERTIMTGADFSRASMNKAMLSTSLLPIPFPTDDGFVELEPGKMNEANLTNAILVDADLRGVEFNYSTLTNADLTGSDLTEANLFKADLSGADLTGATLTRASFKDATLDDRTRLDSKWRQIWELVNGVRAYDLRKMDLTGANLGYIDLSGKNLSGLDLSQAECDNCPFVQANLEGANLTGALIYSPDFSGANLKETVFKDTYMIEAIMDGADLAGADLTNAMLGYANLSGALNLTDEQLASAKDLLWARMPDGSIYNGRFRLSADLAIAKKNGISLDNPQAMADFFRVTLEEYEAGQAWADANP